MQKTVFYISNCLRSIVCCLLLGIFQPWLSFAGDDRWDLNWLLNVDPATLSDSDLLEHAHRLEHQYQQYNQYNGILWIGAFANPDDSVPTRYSGGADNALFTGFYLAAATYRFLVTHHESDLDVILITLRGIHILTHISGIPGVIVRNAFPLAQAYIWNYPNAWERRIKKGFVYESPENVPDILNPSETYEKMVFYAKATRDQLTGILFGLSVALGYLRSVDCDDHPHLTKKIKASLQIIDLIGSDIFERLASKRFKIKDHANRTGTTASKVSGLLKLQLFALRKEILRSRGDLYADEYGRFMKTYKRQFRKSLALDGVENFLQPVIGGYYAWNLRLARIFSVWLLEHDSRRKEKAVTYARRRIWRYIKHHENTHFIFLYNLMKGNDFVNLDEGITSLKRFYFRPMRSWCSPLAGKERRPNFIRRLFRADKKFVVPAHLRKFSRFFLWQKDPYRVGKHIYKEGVQRSPGLSFLLPYWMGRYYGFLPTP